MSNGQEIKVLVVDDDFFARSDLVGRLARHSRIRVVGETHSPKGALTLLRSGNMEALPDVILLDLAYERPGTEVAESVSELLSVTPEVKVLGMSVREDEALALDAVGAGAAGVVWKNEVRSRICTAVIRTHEGFCMFTPGVVARLFGKTGQLPGDTQLVHETKDSEFTPRLEQVARLWCEQGMSARSIAEELHLTENTVRGYVKEIYQILGVSYQASEQNQRQRAYESRVDGDEGQ